MHKTSVIRRADRESWPFVTDNTKGGSIRAYIVRHLPEEIRIQVARHRVASGQMIVAPAVAEAVEKARGGRKDKAAQAEVERIRQERQHAAFAQLAEEKQAVAYARRDVLLACEAYLAAAAADRKKEGIAEFARLYNGGEIRMTEVVRGRVPSVSVSTIMRWQRDFRASGLLGLVNGYHNPKQGSTTLTPEQQDLAISILVRHPHCKINTIQDGLQARFNGQTPHCSAIRRFVNRWKGANASLLLYLANPDAWRGKHMLAFGDASEQVERINQRWEFDSTPADVLLTDGRHCLIGVIDVASRRFKLLVSKSSRATAVAALTRRAILDWGVPETVKTDNGSDYVSRHLVGAFEALRIEQILCPPFTPEAKPHIERAFKTFSHGIVELLPGYIGHSVADRKDIEARRSFADRLMRRAEPGTDAEPVAVSLTAEQLQALCDRWVEAIYHHNPHRGLDNRTPAEVARLWQGTERRITDERALDVLLAEAPRESCQVTKKGIKIEHRYYISEDLAGMAGDTVRVKLDPTDFGTIYVFAASGKFLCVAIDPLRLGHNRAEIAAKSKALQKQIMREGARELKKMAREQAVDQIHMEILEHREAQVANIVELPRRSEEYSTPALEEAARAVAAIDTERRGQLEMDEIISDSMVHVDKEERISLARKRPKEKVVLIFTDSQRYDQIKDTAKARGYISRDNWEWLDEYYQTVTGRMYYKLEGDLRRRWPMQGDGQVEA
ncbi:MAG: transposase [Desulfobulbaceae bacterium]